MSRRIALLRGGLCNVYARGLRRGSRTVEISEPALAARAVIDHQIAAWVPRM